MQTQIRMIACLILGLLALGCVDAKSQFETDVRVADQLKALAEVQTSVGDNLHTLADVKTDLQAVGNKVGFINEKLEKLVEQNQKASVTADKVDHLEQSMKQQLAEKLDMMHKEITAGSIHYGGAGWVVVSAALVVLLFLAAGVGVVYVATRNAAKFKNLLALVTSAVQQSPPEVREAVTAQIEAATNGGGWDASHKQALAAWVDGPAARDSQRVV